MFLFALHTHISCTIQYTHYNVMKMLHALLDQLLLEIQNTVLEHIVICTYSVRNKMGCYVSNLPDVMSYYPLCNILEQIIILQ